MAELSAADRDKLPDSAFAIVKTVGGKKVRQYPIHDAAHAKDALARVDQNGSPEDKAAVRKAVCGRSEYAHFSVCTAEKIAGKLRGK